MADADIITNPSLYFGLITWYVYILVWPHDIFIPWFDHICLGL